MGLILVAGCAASIITKTRETNRLKKNTKKMTNTEIIDTNGSGHGLLAGILITRAVKPVSSGGGYKAPKFM